MMQPTAQLNYTGSIPSYSEIGTNTQISLNYSYVHVDVIYNASEISPTSNPHLLPTGLMLPNNIIVGIAVSLIIAFAIAGNVLVCVAVVTDRNLRKTPNFFIVSLAIADTLVAALVMTFAVANDLMGYWVFGQTFCSIWMSFDIMCSTASILNLCAISLDRYLHIKNPLHYEQMVTPRRAVLAISALWLLSGLISFIPIHLGWHRMGMAEPDIDPTQPYFICLLELNPIYAVISSCISFYAPCLVMITIYLKLYRYARKAVSAIKRTTRLSATDDNRNTVSDHKAAITVGVIMGLFLFCWTPFFTINIVSAFCPSCIPLIVFMLCTWLGYFNSTLNPVIYSIFNTEFREAFKRILSCISCPKLKHFKRPIRFTQIPQQNNAYGSTVAKSNAHKPSVSSETHITTV